MELYLQLLAHFMPACFIFSIVSGIFRFERSAEKREEVEKRDSDEISQYLGLALLEMLHKYVQIYALHDNVYFVDHQLIFGTPNLRIPCQNSPKEDPLITPCLCKGSIESRA